MAARQNELSLEWYDNAVKLLAGRGGAQAMAELSILCSLAASYAVFYVSLGLPVPELPLPELGPPRNIEVASYVHQTFRNVAMGFAPRVRSYKESVDHFVPGFDQAFATTAFLPLAHCALSPFDFPAFQQRSDSFYVNTFVSGFSSLPEDR